MYLHECFCGIYVFLVVSFNIFFGSDLCGIYRAGSWSVQGAQWNRVFLRYGPQKKIIVQ